MYFDGRLIQMSVLEEINYLSFNKDLLVKILIVLSSVLFMLAIYYLINIANKYVNESGQIIITKSFFVKSAIMIFCLLVFSYTYKNFMIVRTFTMSLLVSVLLAYLFNPLVKSLSKRLKTSNVISIMILYIIVFFVIALLSFTIIPRTIKDTKDLINKLPVYYQNMSKIISSYVSNYIDINKFNSTVEKGLLNFKDLVLNSKGFEYIGNTAKSVMSLMFGMVLVPIFTFYLLKDKEDILGYLKKYIPQRHKEKTLQILNKIDDEMLSFISGRIKMAIFVGAATFIVLFLMGVDFAFVIGIITMIADIIPYIGPLMGLVPAFVFSFMESPLKAVWIFVLYIFIQWLENNVVGPKILSDETGLHPIVVLFALILGGALFGFLGMILSVPFILVSKMLYNELLVEYIKK